MGKAEKQICSQEGQKPSSNECRCQEEVVGVDEGAVGSEEKVESIVPCRVRARSGTLDSLAGYIVCGCWELNRKFRLTRFSLHHGESDMIKHEILQPEGILIVEPLSALAAEDFQALTSEVNEYLAGHPDLRGVLIHARAFPGGQLRGFRRPYALCPRRPHQGRARRAGLRQPRRDRRASYRKTLRQGAIPALFLF